MTNAQLSILIASIYLALSNKDNKVVLLVSGVLWVVIGISFNQ
jgi:hypothetical protein